MTDIVESESSAWTVYSTVWHAARVAAADSSVAVGAGGGVAVGWGTKRVCPATRSVQFVFRLFVRMMILAETLKKAAIE